MRYIRFLKPPKLQSDEIKALITITSDLGDSFLPEEIQLSASLRSAEDHGDVYLRKAILWKAGMRSLPVTFDVKNSDIDWPARVHVTQRGAPISDHFEKHHDGSDLPTVISAWSDTINPLEEKHEASRIVERRFTPLNNRLLCIWEETGESIARHVWDAGLALISYLDRMIALQAEGLPLVEQSISSATFKKLRVIELGSGCGIVGISLAQAVPDCDVLLTDLPEAREIAERNIASMNPAMGSKAQFLELNWDNPLPQAVQARSFDIVLVADCTYNPDSHETLVQTLASLVDRSPRAVVLLSMKVRHQSELSFFDLMDKANFVREHPVKLLLPEFGSEPENVLVYVFHHKDRPTYADNTDVKLLRPAVRFWAE